jgi:peptide/nickel transport system substrate-binding protein
MKRLILPAILAASAGFYFTSCGGDEAVHHDNSQVFRFNELGDVTSLDPAMSGSFENNWAVNQLFNGLVEMDAELNVQPCIAKSWTISDDGLTYTFNLRSDVVFHDDPQFPNGKGRNVTAADFVYSFSRLFDATVSNASTLMEAFDENSADHTNGLEAQNDSTFVIHLEHPFKPFLGILTMKYFSVVPKEVVQFYGKDFEIHPIGTGPFKLKKWEDDTRLDLERNANYFKKDAEGNQLPYLDIVSVSFIEDADAAFLQLLSGDLDMLTGVDAINKEKTLKSDGTLADDLQDRFVLQSAPFLKTDYIGINVDPQFSGQTTAMQNKLVRQAINYAVNRDQIVRYRRNNLGTPATQGFTPPSMHAFDVSLLKGYRYDPDKARELLEMANFPGGKGLPTIKLSIAASYADIADEIVHQLNEIGIPAEVELMDAGALTTEVAEGRIMAFRKSWIGDYPDPENFMSLFYSKHWSPAGVNYTHFTSTEYDRLYEKCLTEQSDSVRADLFLRMEQILIEEAPIVPLYYDQVVRLVAKNVSGLSTDPMNLINLERVKKN